MATITFRTEDETRDALEDLATSKGVPLSVLLRDQVDQLLGRAPGATKDASKTVSLSLVQRRSLALQHQILATLSDEDHDREYHSNLAEVLNAGYAPEYDKVFYEVELELTREQCRELWDILDMFRVLESSIERLKPELRSSLDNQAVTRLSFGGFDFNDAHEARLHSYLEYLVKTGRWEEIAARFAEIGDGGNSHMPRMAQYLRMLKIYKPIMEKRRAVHGHSLEAYNLDLEDLNAIENA